MRQEQRLRYFVEFIQSIVVLAPLDLSEKDLWHKRAENESLAKMGCE